MTREEILTMAQESGFGRLLHGDGLPTMWAGADIGMLERFAALVLAKKLAVPDGMVLVSVDLFKHLVADGLAQTIGDAVDCTRVWSAWSCGTMSSDDFQPVTERLEEFVETAVHAMLAAAQKGCE